MNDFRPQEKNQVFNWLTLERIPRVGPLSIAKLYEAFGDPGTALKAGAKAIRAKAGLSEKLADLISSFKAPEKEIWKDIESLEKIGAGIVTRWDPDYPSILKEIYDPPAILFVRGHLSPADDNAVGIVGTRNPTRYGIEMTENITQGLVRAGITIVSGLARGIDTSAHEEALRLGGRTFGVLGCGLEVVYPRENKALIDRIPESGAVITEFRPKMPPLATNFYRRNRIISGLSKGVVVVEATLNSGSLITAGHALEQNRDIFAVPGSILSKRSQGPHKLIKQGACLCESAQDIVDGLFAVPKSEIQRSLFSVPEESVAELSDSARNVLDTLEIDPVPIDYLCGLLKIEAGQLGAILMELEINGLVRQYPGKMFARNS